MTALALAIGVDMGLDEEQLEGLAFAGEVHDIGKVAVPAEILTKPAKLSDIEFTIVRMHSEAGREILESIAFRQPVAQIVVQHHERLDGSGYPDGLKRDEILLEARILAIADVVEAMASHRPYRPGLGLEAALAEVRRGAAPGRSTTRTRSRPASACSRRGTPSRRTETRCAAAATTPAPPVWSPRGSGAPPRRRPRRASSRTRR